MKQWGEAQSLSTVTAQDLNKAILPVTIGSPDHSFKLCKDVNFTYWTDYSGKNISLNALIFKRS